jgi:hypothetical protein
MKARLDSDVTVVTTRKSCSNTSMAPDKHLSMKQILFALAIAFLSMTARGVELQKIMQDTQRLANDPSQMTIVWWIPVEFWDAVLRDNPKVTKEARAQFSKVMDPYLVFAVASLDVGPLGGMTPKDRATVEANAQLMVGGKIVVPVKADRLSPDAQNFVTMMKPMMANMLGKFGQGIEFLLYANPKGAQKISAVNRGSFSYTAFGHRFDWRLPIGSFLPPKIDEKTKEVFPGDYLYNPYTGEKLSEKPVQPQAGANGSQSIRRDTNSTFAVAGSRRSP